MRILRGGHGYRPRVPAPNTKLHPKDPAPAAARTLECRNLGLEGEGGGAGLRWAGYTSLVKRSSAVTTVRFREDFSSLVIPRTTMHGVELLTQANEVILPTPPRAFRPVQSVRCPHPTAAVR
eukprot:gene16322-biopygen6756